MTDTTYQAPAEEALVYEKVRFNATLVIESPYNGAPNPEVDEAWDKLLSSRPPIHP